jgi:opacity protein-like surface antigen
MRSIVMGTLLSIAVATTAFAQSRSTYVIGGGGFATTSEATAGAASGEVGFEVAKNLFVLGNVGTLRNVEPSIVQPTVDTSVAAATAQGLFVAGQSRVSTRYFLAGVRYEIPRWTMVTPYVSGGIGTARLTPSASFTYQSGTTVAGTTAIVGADATNDVETSGLFTPPASTNAMLMRFGAGLKIPIGTRLLGDIGYSVSRISSDTPVSAQGLQFGVGIRF